MTYKEIQEAINNKSLTYTRDLLDYKYNIGGNIYNMKYIPLSNQISVYNTKINNAFYDIADIVKYLNENRNWILLEPTEQVINYEIY